MNHLPLPSKEQFDEIIEQMKVANNTKTPDDVFNTPGPKHIIGGDKQAGFYGFVEPHEFGVISGNEAPNDTFNGSNLALALGLSDGTVLDDNVSWMKFSYLGRIQFIPMRTLRRSLDWDSIYAVGAVYGTGSTISDGEQFMLDNDENYSVETRVEQDAQVTIDGKTYKVRLMKGVGADPTDSYDDADRGAAGADNEWNNLILPLHEKAPNNFNYASYADAPTDDWGINLTDVDLITHRDFGLGSYSWCQETQDTILSDETSNIRRVRRGGLGVSSLYAGPSSNVGTYYGWRPVLELV